MDFVGIDPGGRDTGIVVRRGNDVVTAWVLRRDTNGVLPDAAYLNEVLDVVADSITASTEATGETPMVCVEGVREPSWYMGGKPSPANMGGLMATCMVLGAVLSTFPDAEVVPPARHGAAHPNAYPAPLRPTRGSGKGHDRRRHTRSAWDVTQSVLWKARF